MKKMKKMVALVLAMVMVLAMGSMTAFAEGTNSITVNNAKKDETYKIYKMLDLSVNTGMTAYTYTVNSAWGNFFSTGGVGAAYVDIDEQGYVTWKSGKDTASDMEAFGKAAAKYAEDNTIATAADDQIPTSDGTVIFEGLDSGYYLVTSTYGTLAMVDTTPADPYTVITEKNPGIPIDKVVQEDSDQSWGSENSAQIGDTINFKITTTIKKGSKNFKIHDKMADGLTFNADSVAIRNLTKGGEYNVITSGLEDECTFEIHFTQEYLDSITNETALTVTYNAVLNENADLIAGENNDAKPTWGNNSTTEWESTNTKTYQFAVLKYDAKDEEKNPLADAVFQLKDASNNVVKLVKVSDTEYRVANGNETGAAETFKTVAAGAVVIKGVDLDTYTLVETVAPAGYNLLKDTVSVVVSKDNKLVVDVPNNSGVELPSTGGIGTTIFYVLGAILVLAAGVILVTRKRMSMND